MEKHLFYPEKFPDLLEKIQPDSETIKATIKNYSLRFSDVKDTVVEWESRFPMFVDAFYDYVLSENTIPTQDDFYACYIDRNSASLSDKNLSKETADALKARIYRAYPSLVRDIFFNKYVKENLISAKVVYNGDLDVSEGIDLMVSIDNLHCGINLYTDTKRSHEGRMKKKSRHDCFENVIYVDFPVNFNGSLRCGDFFLYGHQEYIDLVDLLILMTG